MALLGNYSVIMKNPFTPIGGTQVSNVRSAFNSSGQNKQRYYADTDGLPLTASLPTGTEPPFSYLLAYRGGELSSTTQINGTSTFSGALSNGINIVANIAGAGDISTASLSLVTSMTATLTGSGGLTASMVGVVNMIASLAGSGNLAGALSMLSGLTASLAGSGSVTADLKGTLYMEATIYVNEGAATVQQIVDAVWSALATEYNVSGTMGNKLNGAGSAGDPWTTDLTAYTTANTAGKILKDRLSKGQFLGLK